MTPQQIWQMAMKVSPILASGLLIGSWFAIQYPDTIKNIFASPINGLVALLLSVWINYKQESETNTQINNLKATLENRDAKLSTEVK